MSEPRETSAGHPGLEDMAIYVDGGMDAAGRDRFEAHVADCDACRELLAELARMPEDESAGRVLPFVKPARIRAWWIGGTVLAAAASVVLIVRVLQQPHARIPELVELVAAVSKEPARPADGRLSGGFTYAPPPAVTRGRAETRASTDVQIAALKLQKLAATHDSADTRAALGVGYLTLGETEKAIEALEAAVARVPENPMYQNDLSVAYLARAAASSREEDYSRALAAADRALRIDPAALEPRFNRALALEGLHRSDDAQRAWSDYLARDNASEWAREAAARRTRP